MTSDEDEDEDDRSSREQAERAQREPDHVRAELLVGQQVLHLQAELTDPVLVSMAFAAVMGGAALEDWLVECLQRGARELRDEKLRRSGTPSTAWMSVDPFAAPATRPRRAP